MPYSYPVFQQPHLLRFGLDLYNCGFISKTVKEKTDKAREDDDEKFWDNYLKTEFQADDKIQASAGKSTNNNPESKARGENDE